MSSYVNLVLSMLWNMIKICIQQEFYSAGPGSLCRREKTEEEDVMKSPFLCVNQYVIRAIKK